jgi:hypothetical protein
MASDGTWQHGRREATGGEAGAAGAVDKKVRRKEKKEIVDVRVTDGPIYVQPARHPNMNQI